MLFGVVKGGIEGNHIFFFIKSRLSTNTDLKIRFLSKMLPKVLVCNFRDPVSRKNYCHDLRTSNQPWGEIHTARNKGYPLAASTAQVSQVNHFGSRFSGHLSVGHGPKTTPRL